MINQFKYDKLTGAYNKEFFYQQIKEIILQHPEQKYDIICSDIENFKLVNDIYGIKAGDNLLRSVADVYRRYVGEHGIFGRLDADQFVCLLEHHWDYSNSG